MSQIAYPPVQQALERLRALSADDATRHQAFVRELALMVEISEKRAEREQGKLESQTAVLQKLLTKRFGELPQATVERLNCATSEQLERWIDVVLDAPTLNAMFAEH